MGDEAVTPQTTLLTMQRRHCAVFTAVVVAHAAALWMLQHGLQSRPQDHIVAAEVLMEWVTPAPSPQPQPQLQPTPMSAPKPVPTKTQTPVAPAPKPPAPAAPSPVVAPVASEPVEMPVAQASPPASASAPASSATASSVTSAPPTQSAAPAAPKIELPSSQADYLNNPRPPYPPLSKRLGEQGRVVLRVRIETDGSASQAEIQRSSGFERLDQTALQTVLRWRFVPGKRNGVPEAMWFNIPINFVLE